MTRVTQLIHDAGKYLLIYVYPLPTHPTHNFTHNNGGNLETLPGWPKKLQHNRPAQSAGQQQDATLASSGVKIPVNVKMSASMGSSIIQSRSWHEYSGSNEPEQQHHRCPLVGLDIKYHTARKDIFYSARRGYICLLSLAEWWRSYLVDKKRSF